MQSAPKGSLWDLMCKLLERVRVLEEVVAQGKDECEKQKALLDKTVTRIEHIERLDADNGACKLEKVEAEMHTEIDMVCGSYSVDAGYA